MRAHDWVMLLVLSLVWGGSFFFVGVAVAELPPLTIVTLRVGLAALALLAYLKITGQKVPVAPRILAAFVGMGLLNNVIPFSLIVWGQGHIASGLASILNATMPLSTVIVAHFLTRDEKATSARIFGVVAGIAGVAVMIGPDVLFGSDNNLLAQLAILAAALSYAFASIFGRRFKEMGVLPVATATGQVTASSVLLAPVALVVEQPWNLPMPSLATVLSVVALALAATAFAYILYFRILSSAGATNLSLVTFLVPVSAILLGILFLHETLLVRHFAGFALIGVGLAAIDGRVMRLIKGRGR